MNRVPTLRSGDSLLIQTALCYTVCMQTADILIIGGGIIGLATAYHLLQQAPDKKVVLLEKEAEVATHQSGRNSGVLHSGIYYAVDSLKAYHCRYGKGLMRSFCKQENLPFKKCDKVIVAIDGAELQQLHTLYQRGVTNGVACHLIDAHRLRELEPHAAGIAAIHVPDVGVVDFQQVAVRLAMRIEQAGGRILTNHHVTGMKELRDGVVVQTKQGSWIAPRAVNAAGLHADRVAGLTEIATPVKIVPFRGEYYRLRPGRTHLVNSLIYPVPNPALPFLGVHFTRTLYGDVDCGPNAVLTTSREGYGKINVNLRDLADYTTSRRLRRLTAKHLKTAVWETRRSLSKELFTLTLQRLVPAVQEDDLIPAAAGVRAQAVDADGNLIKDFVVQETARIVHVLSAPSPGATSSLSLGRTIANTVLVR